MFSHPALSARNYRSNPQCEALVAEQGVTIAGSERPNGVFFREMNFFSIGEHGHYSVAFIHPPNSFPDEDIPAT